ncbi:hypothetical protein T4B_5745 [Trichinella pseudospiralis]|uniref:Uncharacterized protein n=1 Tax=Trichinella pseudospiralis TaxID=6337 RepID=A0A0V1JIL3_TRIPS|nr:hypothetical protein T4A_12495 [Trichinella pseudospiralis]KRZ34833.1 hypothetical protein T4B_5745 [Trichinella pseudospiralis]
METKRRVFFKRDAESEAPILSSRRYEGKLRVSRRA